MTLVGLTDYLQQAGTAAVPVNRFDGFEVQVGVPADWEPYDAALGGRLWISRGELGVKKFCANAVLTMHELGAPLESGAVYARLCQQQVESVSGALELDRTLATASEGPGVAGTLKLRIPHELGALSSISTTRILTTEHQMLIAQLTVTALIDSPAATARVWLRVHTHHGAVAVHPVAPPFRSS